VDLVKGFDPGPKPTNGMQIIMPPVPDIAAGESDELCSTTTIQLTSKIDIQKISAVQAIAGHHVALYWSAVAGDATPHVCTDADMVNFRFIGFALSHQDDVAPTGIAFEVPEGAFLAVQQHYLNETDNTVTSQTAVNLYYEDAGATFTPSHGLAFTDSTLTLAPGPDTLNIHCVMQNNIKAWMIMPHMHQYGTSFYATWTHAGTATMLENEPTWQADWEFEAPQTLYAPTQPLLFSIGDTVDVQCNWNNTTSAPLPFGDEMCVFFAQTVDDTGLGNLACDDGSWTAF
jgi:hypothetical protein